MVNKIPDRVPAVPDISNYIPCKRTGLPFWDIYFYEKIPLWEAYLKAMDYFGGEAWVASCCAAPLLQEQSKVERLHQDVYDRDRYAMIRRTTIRTPDGDLTQELTCFRYDPPSPTQKPIKNLQKDFQKFKWLLTPPTGIDSKKVDHIRQECDQRDQAFGLCLGYPGFQFWEASIQGGVQALSYALMDCPQILDEWFELDLARGTKEVELILSVQPDYVLFGGSGTITLASPQLAMKYAIPAIARWSKLAKDADVPTMLHSCGKSRELVKLLVEHTDVNMFNPLEPPPMGDIDLAEIKAQYGQHMALMGNLHTTDIMLRSSPEQVKEKAIAAIRDAGEHGGFILSTGDQCPRDTPEENIFALIEAAKEFGNYDQTSGRLRG
ncbi:MAG: uroporphyrinogen decarboxylase family protein [Planctomycetota bacterium]|jgi:uroporphyrinogen decarboxylase